MYNGRERDRLAISLGVHAKVNQTEDMDIMLVDRACGDRVGLSARTTRLP